MNLILTRYLWPFERKEEQKSNDRIHDTWVSERCSLPELHLLTAWTKNFFITWLTLLERLKKEGPKKKKKNFVPRTLKWLYTQCAPKKWQMERVKMPLRREMCRNEWISHKLTQLEANNCNSILLIDVLFPPPLSLPIKRLLQPIFISSSLTNNSFILFWSFHVQNISFSLVRNTKEGPQKC